ncbi:cadherin-related family member 1a-like [Tubulanus polymorphus]|uniref:cadherin-related family member 1a-like n=1 Tax=Tubulanus polymorphus TaxID=672921 RepID=UPI003DA35704
MVMKMKSPGCHSVIVLFFILTDYAFCQKNLAPRFVETLENIIGFKGIPEDTPIGTTIGYLKAIDPEGLPLTYGMKSDTYECINPSTGLVILSRRLDRETNTQTKVIVTAEDSTGHRFSKTNLISHEYEAVILDINDNRPFFRNVPYRTDVEENTPIGSTIYNRISMRDDDRGLNAEMELLCVGNTPNMKEACDYFAVKGLRVKEGEYTGEVIVKKKLDYETHRDFILHLMAKDMGQAIKLNTSVNMIIEVKDVQDSSPRFLNAPISLFTSEDKPVNSKLGVVQAVDQDGTHRNLTIQLIDDANGFFRIGTNISRDRNNGIHTADIILNKPLNREIKDHHNIRFKCIPTLVERA